MMRNTITLFSLLFISVLGFSQKSNLVIFSEQGERFQVVLNGIMQNAQPETNVMITDLIASSYQATILFEDKGIKDMQKIIYFNTPNVQLTLKIKQNKKGKYVLRMFNEVPLAQAPPRSATQNVVVYSTTPPPTTTTVTHTTTTSTSTQGQPTETENVNMSVNMGGVNMSMNVNVNDGGSSTSTTSTTYTETHTTTSTSTSTTGGEVYEEEPATYVLPGYNGPYGCPFPMSQTDFADAKKSISSKSFSDSKVTLAKQIINSNCLLSSQVMEMMELFDYEDDKLDIAKYAFGNTLDYGNYYKVNNAFEYESTIEELDEYIQSFRR